MTDRYAPARARSAAKRRHMVARCAALLAEGYSISAAARHLGVSQQTASAYFQQMRKDLGWQAC